MNTTILKAPASPAPVPSMSLSRVLGAYAAETHYEFLQLLRAPAFAIPFLAIPVAIYLLFGALMGGSSPGAQENPQFVNLGFSGMCALAVMMPTLFSGCNLALERDMGLLRLKRALPVPGGAYVLAKLLAGLMFAALAVALVVAAALVVGKITLSLVAVLSLAGALVGSGVATAAIGLFIGAYASGQAAPAFGNLVFLPMMWLSGLLIPLPEFMQRWVVVWPAFHMNQLALAAAGVEEFVFLGPAFNIGVLAGVTVLFGGLAIRRLARAG